MALMKMVFVYDMGQLVQGEKEGRRNVNVKLTTGLIESHY